MRVPSIAMIISPVRCLLVAWILGASVAAQDGWLQNFDADRADHPPSGFTLAAMRQPDAGRWLVARDGPHQYLVHRAQTDTKGYALAVADRSAPDDISISARIRMAGGGRVGGLVWRYEDDRNYYALLLDLDRADLSIYRISSGNRIRLDVADGLELDSNAWHALKVSHIDSDIRVSLGGVRVFEEQDRRANRPGTTPGKAGLIATGHSEVWFDDLHVEPKRGRR